jgi:hypothetical protein
MVLAVVGPAFSEALPMAEAGSEDESLYLDPAAELEPDAAAAADLRIRVREDFLA